MNSTIRMLFDTTMPTIITTPISDCTLSVVPVRYSASSTPVRPGGTASRISSGSVERAELRDEDQIQQHEREQQAERRSSETTPACPAPCRAVATRTPAGSVVPARTPRMPAASRPRSSPAGLT